MIAVVLSLVAAALNAAASVFQRCAGRDEPDEQTSTLRMLLHLVRRPSWVAGILAMMSGFGLEAVALSLGRLALVEPLMVAELPLTLLGATLMFRRRLGGPAWAAIGALAIGLAAFVFALAPEGGDPTAVPLWQWLVAGGITVGAAAVAVIAGWGRRRLRAALWGIGTGITFGLMSALVSGVGAAFGQGGVAALMISWQTYAAVVVGPASFFLLQHALQAGSLVASQPGFTLLNPLVSVLWGVFVFGEQVRGGAWLALAAAGAVVVAVATLALVRTERRNDGPDAVDDGADDPADDPAQRSRPEEARRSEPAARAR